MTEHSPNCTAPQWEPGTANYQRCSSCGALKRTKPANTRTRPPDPEDCSHPSWIGLGRFKACTKCHMPDYFHRVRFVGKPYPETWLAFVADTQGAETRVRKTPTAYKCDRCGNSPTATQCPHTEAAANVYRAMQLTEHLLTNRRSA